MSTNHRTPRRRALSASLATLVAAGAASALPSPTVAAQAPQALPIDREAIGAWLAEYHRQAEALSEQQSRAFDAIVDRVGDDGWQLADNRDVAIGLRSDLERDRLFMLLSAHVPGLAPALRLIYGHVIETSYGDEAACCAEVTLPPL